jgi:hypothetical protein
MIQNDTQKASKNIRNFVCDVCDYSCSKKGDWNRHILRPKHIKLTNMIQQDTENGAKDANALNQYICNCGNTYRHHSGLWRHKKKCNNGENISIDIQENTKSDEINELKEFMKYLMQENSEMKNMMMEVIKNGTISNTNSHNTISNNNSHNKAFNLQFFLNETCKDAMNITDFVESIKLQVSDLENVAEVGYIEGISNIIVNNLKKLDVTQRPVHCTDKKRETMYVKDQDTWEKDEENKKMHRVVKKVTDKNARLILKYKELHPDCMTYHSRFNDKYNKIIVESMGGSGDNMFEKEEKIIAKVSKEVTVDKESL